MAEEYKREIKNLLKSFQFKEALLYVNKNPIDLLMKLSTPDKVLVAHWSIKVFLACGRIGPLSSHCLTKLNTLINKLKLKEYTIGTKEAFELT